MSFNSQYFCIYALRITFLSKFNNLESHLLSNHTLKQFARISLRDVRNLCWYVINISL